MVNAVPVLNSLFCLNIQLRVDRQLKVLQELPENAGSNPAGAPDLKKERRLSMSVPVW